MGIRFEGKGFSGGLYFSVISLSFCLAGAGAGALIISVMSLTSMPTLGAILVITVVRAVVAFDRFS